MKPFVFVLAAMWGVIWAAVLQFSSLGRFLAARRTWLTVVVGLGCDLVLLRALLSTRDWLRVVGLIACSSAGIIGRSIINESREHRDFIAHMKG